MVYRRTERTERHARTKEEAFVHAAHELVAHEGFAGAKVAAVAGACGVSAGSLYSYFGSRDELLARVFRRAAGRELAAVRGAVDAAPARPEARLEAFADTFTVRALRGRRLAWALLFEPVSPVVERERLLYRREYAHVCEGVIRDGVAVGRFARQDPAIAAGAVIGAISEALVGRLSPEVAQRAEVPDDQLVAEIRDFCLRALGRVPA
ncbi:TetR/AcrR family transcriptional regulator [Streptomyces laurentii]|uniref:TetR/AcrR family transcriptional regulator n=1 Tax=Streptomyces laurentii TaxID=39478 RepID=UPI00369560FC